MQPSPDRYVALFDSEGTVFDSGMERPLGVMVHGWSLVASVLPEGQQAIDKIGQFVQQKTA